MEDVLTDLNGEAEVLPLSPPRDDWLGHKGIVQAAEYIRKKLLDEEIMSRAFAKVLFHVAVALNVNDWRTAYIGGSLNGIIILIAELVTYFESRNGKVEYTSLSNFLRLRFDSVLPGL